MPYLLESSRLIYEGKRIVVKSDDIVQPNGTKVMREVVSFANAAAVLPVTDDGNVVLIKQFRYPVGGFIYEIPAGVLDGSEEPIACAIRELKEEIGAEARTIEALGKIHTSPGVCTEVIYLFVAKGLTFSEKRLEYGEIIEPEEFSFEKALAMTEDGSITDAKTICALLLFSRKGTRK